MTHTRTSAPTGRPVRPTHHGAHPTRHQLAREHTGGYRPGAGPAADQRTTGSPDRQVAVEAPDRQVTDGRDREMPDPAGAEGAAEGRQLVQAAIQAAEEAVARLAGLELDPLDDAGLRLLLEQVQHHCDRLGAVILAAGATLESRAIRAAGPGREARAVADTRRFLTDRLRLRPAEAKRLSRTGRQARELPRLQTALTDGRIRPDQASVITDTTRHLSDHDRTQITDRLIAAAPTQHPDRLARTARELVADTDPEAARHAHQRAYQARYARLTDLPDGSLLLSARLAPGEQAETVTTWLAAHRQPDTADHHRSPEQATADALVTAARAGLDAGTAPTDHGHRPHIIITVALSDLAAGTGTGQGTWTGPIPIHEIQRLCHDATITRVLTDANTTPMEVSEGRRTVSSGLWKALLVRDGGCRWPHCTAPPAWCDVAHGQIPHRNHGRLTRDNAVLLCRRHHRHIDTNHWTIHIRGPDISFHPPGHTDPVTAGPPHQR